MMVLASFCSHCLIAVSHLAGSSLSMTIGFIVIFNLFGVLPRLMALERAC